MDKYFLNLTNGIEFLENNKIKECDFSFIRIQSSKLERCLWNEVLNELDNNFLMYLAMGYNCMVVDYSPQKSKGRVIFQGIPFIRYVLDRNWNLRLDSYYYVKSNNCLSFFKKIYEKELSDYTLKRITYFKKFLLTDKIKLDGFTLKTNNDTQYEKYKDMLKSFFIKKE